MHVSAFGFASVVKRAEGVWCDEIHFGACGFEVGVSCSGVGFEFGSISC